MAVVIVVVILSIKEVMAVLNVFTAIMDFFSMIGNFVSNLVTGLASMLGIIPQAMTAINYSISYLPDVLMIFATAGIGICIVFHIIGR